MKATSKLCPACGIRPTEPGDTLCAECGGPLGPDVTPREPTDGEWANGPGDHGDEHA